MIPARGFDLRVIDGPDGPIPCVVRGPVNGPAILFLQPLFEELNRVRRLMALLGGHLAGAGYRTWLPDLPGCGDAPGDPDVAAWQRTVAHVAHISGANAVVAVRGGCLLAPQDLRRCLIAPVETGATLLRDLMRAQALTEGPAGGTSAVSARLESDGWASLAGYPVGSGLTAALAALACERGSADLVLEPGDGDFDGPLLWRQPEPEPCDALAEALAARITAWLAA